MSEQTRDDVAVAYSQHGTKYDEARLETPRGALLTTHDLVLFDRLLPELPADAHVVEVGAGTGRFTLPALERGWRVEATDVNETLLEQLRVKMEQAGHGDRCTVHTDDIFDLSMRDASIDFLYSIHVIPRFRTLEDQRLALREIARVLRPGGRLLFNYRNAASLLYGRVDREHAARPAEIEAILADAGLEIEALHGKWILNGRLVDLVGAGVGRVLAAADRALWSFAPRRAWDVFVSAVKR